MGAAIGASWRRLRRELREELTSLVLPSGCAGCGLPEVRGELCTDCAGALACAVPRRVRPSPVPPGLPRVYAALPYADEARKVLLAHKERGALRLAAPLGALLADVVRKADAGAWISAEREAGKRPLTLVPVPSARRAVACRGHDPVRRIALAAAGELRRGGRPARVLAVLRQRRSVADQAGLTSRERTLNMSGALELVPGSATLLAGGVTLLVDDVMTTGASLAEAARAVAEHAGEHVGEERRTPLSPAVYAAAVIAHRHRA